MSLDDDLDLLIDTVRGDASDSSPDASAARRAALRRLLRRLDADPVPEPPSGLAERTVRIALQRRGTPTPARPSAWRRSDLMAVAAVVLLGLLVLPAALTAARRNADRVACAEQLRLLHGAIVGYMEKHGGYVPIPEPEGPWAWAGMFVVRLRDEGLWVESMRLSCPGDPARPPASFVPPTSFEMQRQADARANWPLPVRSSYGFHLGYRPQPPHHTAKLLPIHRDHGDEIPLVADRPPRWHETTDWPHGNSPNHGRLGQNVLYSGGQVRFVTLRGVPDDIYLNGQRQPSAGWGPRDAVLGPSEAPPLPPGE